MLVVKTKDLTAALQDSIASTIKIAPVEHIREVALAVGQQGISVRKLPMAPRPVRYDAASSYFELDRNGPYWAKLGHAAGIEVEMMGHSLFLAHVDYASAKDVVFRLEAAGRNQLLHFFGSQSLSRKAHFRERFRHAGAERGLINAHLVQLPLGASRRCVWRGHSGVRSPQPGHFLLQRCYAFIQLLKGCHGRSPIGVRRRTRLNTG